jgi:hypothetical protein
MSKATDIDRPRGIFTDNGILVISSDVSQKNQICDLLLLPKCHATHESSD